VQALAAIMQPMNTTRGTNIAKQGEPANSLYFLQRGEVQVTNLGETVVTLFAPTVFAEAALLKDRDHTSELRLSGYRTQATSMCVSATSLQCMHASCGGTRLTRVLLRCRIWQLELEDIHQLQVIMPHLQEGLLKGLKRTVRFRAPGPLTAPVWHPQRPQSACRCMRSGSGSMLTWHAFACGIPMHECMLTSCFECTLISASQKVAPAPGADAATAAVAVPAAQSPESTE
jgi:Cyclic nucleotide-binding domain